MTTLRDLLNDLIKEAKEIKIKAEEKQRTQLDDDMQSIEEIEEDLESDLLEEYMETIKKRIVG